MSQEAGGFGVAMREYYVYILSSYPWNAQEEVRNDNHGNDSNREGSP